MKSQKDKDNTVLSIGVTAIIVVFVIGLTLVGYLIDYVQSVF